MEQREAWLSYYFNHENPIQKLNFEPIISMIKLAMMSNFQESCGLTSQVKEDNLQWEPKMCGWE